MVAGKVGGKDYGAESLRVHALHKGKISVVSKVPLASRDDMSVAYTPGVAAPCLEIEKNPELAYEYTSKGNLVAIVTDGSAVLGLGNIGALAGMPVMEGKAILFKEFAGVDAFPICLSTQNPDEIIAAVKAIAPTFGGINLEDIKAPECFYIEERLREELDIPVFHDDQHGTAVVVLAALTNALKLVHKSLPDARIVVNGAGAAGTAVAKLLLHAGAHDLIVCDTKGIIVGSRPGLAPDKVALSQITNPRKCAGSLSDALHGADVFIGVSAPGVVTSSMVKTMGKDAIVFALANPVPEIFPDAAKEGGAKIVGTGRSDYPNQINNVLAFPGIFRGVLDARAKRVTDSMQVAASHAIASAVSANHLSADHIIPSALDKHVASLVAKAVMAASKK